MSGAGLPLQPDSSWTTALEQAARLAQLLGLAMGIGTPLVLAGLMLSGVVPPGQAWPPETTRQVGYLFTGLVFLVSAWSYQRSGRTLARFRDLAPGARPSLLLRETILLAASSELSCLLGFLYWGLTGQSAARHAWGFILLTPLLTLALVPRPSRWKQALG